MAHLKVDKKTCFTVFMFFPTDFHVFGLNVINHVSPESNKEFKA